MSKLSPSQKAEVDSKLIQGAVSRASMVSFFFAVAFCVYGFTIHEVLQLFIPDLTLWSNVWPRFAFNSIPFFAYYLISKNYKANTRPKLWLWCIGFPVIFVSACMIHAWPAIWAGNTDLYLYVHGANFLVLLIGLTLVAPPMSFLFLTIGAFVILFVAPVCFFFIKSENFLLLRFFLHDTVHALLLGGVSAYMNFKLRHSLATEDVLNKTKIEKFVGNLVSESIFENNESLVQPRQAHAFLISIDVRGYTRFTQSADSGESSSFKERYHSLVAKAVGSAGGFIHKTHGDGHLISVGLMNETVDLSDIPGVSHDAATVDLRKRQKLLSKTIEIFNLIHRQFELLKSQMGIPKDVCVCAAVDFGEIGLKMLGDPNIRLEFDIEGLIVIRCSRLEAYTKLIRHQISSSNSILVLSQDASKYLTPEMEFRVFGTHENPVRDFPDEKYVFFREYYRPGLKVGAA